MKKLILILITLFSLSFVSCTSGYYTVEEGLREALEVSSKKTVTELSKNDSFAKNENIYIDLPEEYAHFKEGFVYIIFGTEIDGLLSSMNKAAEKSIPYASTIFLDAIYGLTIEDGLNILHGGVDAITNYFEISTRNSLMEIFKPKIKEVMQDNQVYYYYDTIVSVYPAFGEKFNVEEYVAEKTVDGIFYMIKEEEKKIRENPAARITPALKIIFGYLD